MFVADARWRLVRSSIVPAFFLAVIVGIVAATWSHGPTIDAALGTVAVEILAMVVCDGTTSHLNFDKFDPDTWCVVAADSDNYAGMICCYADRPLDCSSY